jgi:hypothetical protein
MKRFDNACRIAALAFAAVLAGQPARAADVCSAARSAVALANLAAAEDGSIRANGTWQVSGGVGVLLEYRIDSGRVQSETRAGASGSWDFSHSESCGRHVFRVYAFPTVAAAGRQVHCLETPPFSNQVFTIPCGPFAAIVACNWECSEPPDARCAGTCTGTARGGRPGGYMAFWGVDGAKFQPSEATGAGPWTGTVACKVGERVSFKVRDQGGIGGWSDPVEKPCGKE